MVPIRLFPGWQVGEEMETSGIDGMKGGSESIVIYEGNLSGFDRKGAMRKDGEAFSAPSIYTD